MPIRFDDSTTVEQAADDQSVGVTIEEMIALFSRFTRIGSWRINIDSSQYEVSRIGHEIYGLAYSGNRASLLAFRECVHPDDLELIGEALSTASERKCSFSLIYRIKDGGSFKFVRTVGAFRPIEGTNGELYGVTYEMLDHVRELVFGA